MSSVTTPPSSPRRRAEGLTALVVALVVTAAALTQLFLGPDLGLADNGDGRRVLCGSGLQPPPVSTAFTEVVFEVGPLTDPVAGFCDRPEMRYSTSQIVLVDTAELIDGLFSDPGIDLRLVGALACVLFGLLMAGLYLGLPGTRTARLLAVGAASALLLDVSYAHYFSSAFSETAGFLGLLAVAAALAWCARRPLGVAPLAALLVATAFLVTAKTQLTPLAGIVIVLVLLRYAQSRRSLAHPRRAVALVAMFVLAVLVGSGLQVAYQGKEFQRANLHNLVLYSVAPLSGDPAEALRDMGLDESMAQYAGSSAFNTQAFGDPGYADFIAASSRTDVVLYLLRNPGLSTSMLEDAVTEVAAPRTLYLSELRASDRVDGSDQASRYAPVTTVLEAASGLAWPVLPVLWVLLIAWGAVLSLRRQVRRVDLRAWGFPLVFVSTAAVAQVGIALIGDGYYELAKHQVFVSYLTCAALALTLGSLADLLLRSRTRSAGAPADPDALGAADDRPTTDPRDPHAEADRDQADQDRTDSDSDPVQDQAGGDRADGDQGADRHDRADRDRAPDTRPLAGVGSDRQLRPAPARLSGPVVRTAPETSGPHRWAPRAALPRPE